MQTCDINRSTLLTGAASRALGEDSGTLFHPETGLSCVMGLYLAASGVPKSYLKNKASVDKDILAQVSHDAYWVTDSGHVGDIIDVNDGNLHQIRREAKLEKLFAEKNVAIRFTGRYADATRTAKRYVATH